MRRRGEDEVERKREEKLALKVGEEEESVGKRRKEELSS